MKKVYKDYKKKGARVGMPMNPRQANVAQWCDGKRSSGEIAELCGDTQKYVQAVMLSYDLPRLKQAGPQGEKNGSYIHGKTIDRDGYALIICPYDHPLRSKSRKYIREHRLVMEKKLGRYLEASEVVDHIDGLRLHNSPTNLRLFENNASHLKQTITGQQPQWNQDALEKVALSQQCGGLRMKANLISAKIDTYSLMKKFGDAKLLQICLAWLKLPQDSPYLLGTHRYLEQAGVDPSDGSKIELLLLELCERWGLDHTRYIS